MACSHEPNSKDIEAGYTHCMFCEEVGECDGQTGQCTAHSVVWDVWADRAADAENSRF